VALLTGPAKAGRKRGGERAGPAFDTHAQSISKDTTNLIMMKRERREKGKKKKKKTAIELCRFLPRNGKEHK